MRPRDRLATTPWRDDHPWPSLIERVTRAQKRKKRRKRRKRQIPQGMVPESWVAGLEECVRSGYLDRPRSVIPFNEFGYLCEVAQTVMEKPEEEEEEEIFDFGVFIAWCCDLRQGAMRDFPELSTRADKDPEITMLARCLDIALAAPSWLSGCHPRVRGLLAEEVQGRLVSEVPDLVARVEALRTWKPDSHQMPSWCAAMALAAVRQWQDDVLDEVDGSEELALVPRAHCMEAGSGRDRPADAGARGALAGDDGGAARRRGGAGEDGPCGVALDPAHPRPAPIG